MEAKIEFGKWMGSSVSLKLIIIGFLVFLLFIPSLMIQTLINERSKSSKDVVDEVTDKWGKEQLISGPVLSVPYKIGDVQDNKQVHTTALAHFLPESLVIGGTINPEIRKRSIYKVVLYNSQLTFSGQFLKPDFKSLNIPNENVLWNDAYLTVGVTDLRGVQKKIEVRWNDIKYFGNPGVLNKQLIDAGVTSEIELEDSTEKYTFSIMLDVNGSEQIRFVPLGKETKVNLTSPWESPGFAGAFLPKEREITTNGFNAEWNILYLNRNYPQQWTSLDTHDINNSAFGVDLVLPVDHYQKATRSVKYAILFLFLTFLVFFINEMVHKYQIHPIQYFLIGLALVIFYLLMLSLSEYIGFNWAYLIAAVATIALITAYGHTLIRKKKGTLLIGVFLLLLYGFLFTLLQLEDYALLLGSIGLFLILAAVMFSSRKINWYRPLAGTDSN
jgi:inner membrane protein